MPPLLLLEQSARSGSQGLLVFDQCTDCGLGSPLLCLPQFFEFGLVLQVRIRRLHCSPLFGGRSFRVIELHHMAVIRGEYLLGPVVAIRC